VQKFIYILACDRKHCTGVDEADGTAYVAVLVFVVRQVPAVHTNLYNLHDDFHPR